MSVLVKSEPGVAFVFPGQGSQSLGMLASLAEKYALVKTLFDEVSAVLGYDLWALTQEGPLAQLNETEFTQVALLTADVAVFRVLQQQGLTPMALAGHSLGEYAALVCADALSLTDAAKLVQTRGRLMQQTVPLGQGAMAAVVGLTDEAVADLCLSASTSNEVVSPANYNAIGQVVVAGDLHAVERLIIAAEQAEARLAKIIPVSVPCHCALLKPAADLFETALQAVTFKMPRWPVLSNVNAAPYESVESIRALLARQLYSPVRWVETTLAIKNTGVSLIIESGPGKVLAGLTKRIDKSFRTISVNDPLSVNEALEALYPELNEKAYD